MHQQPNRSYTSTRRAQQAAQTRADIVAAATALFQQNGWRGTTITSIAAKAGVVPDTVYAGFGSKRALLVAAKDAARDGDAEDVAAVRQADLEKISTGTRAQRIAVAVRLIAAANERTRAIDAVWREAAAGDPALAKELRKREDGRRSAFGAAMTAALDAPPDEQTLDGIWAITGSEVYAKLIGGRGWTSTRYQQWLAETFDRLLP